MGHVLFLDEKYGWFYKQYKHKFYNYFLSALRPIDSGRQARRTRALKDVEDVAEKETLDTFSGYFIIQEIIMNFIFILKLNLIVADPIPIRRWART